MATVNFEPWVIPDWF